MRKCRQFHVYFERAQTGLAIGLLATVAASLTGASPAAQLDTAPPASRTGGAPLHVQGFADLTAERLRELILLDQPETRDPHDDDPCDDNVSEECQPRGGAATGGLERHGHLADLSPLALLQTPPPVTSWKGLDSHNAPADPQIAASSTHVVTTLVRWIGFYSKSGTLLAELSSPMFFAPLGLDDGTAEGIDIYSDMRVIFDEYRKRFWVGAVSRSSEVTAAENRSLVTIAVSKTENPLDGWYFYWWDAAVNWGVPNPGWEPGDSADYPMIGIDPVAFHVVHMIGNDVTNEIPRYERLQFLPAGPLASGQAASGWHYYDLLNPDGTEAGLIQPVVHHGPTGRAYYVSRPGANTSDKVVVWALSDALTPSQQLNRVEVSMPTAWNQPLNASQLGSSKLIRMTNLGTSPLKAVYRLPFLYFSTNDGPTPQVSQFTTVRFVRMSVLAFPNVPTDPATGFISRTFGGSSSIDDPPGAQMFYGWPAVEVNKQHDAVVVYARSGPTIYPEIRFSAYMANENDIRPSRLLKAGEVTYDYPLASDVAQVLRWGDLAGASVDPKDDTGIWIAHQYAVAGPSSNNYAIWVGKVFGKAYYDWHFLKDLLVSPAEITAGHSVEVVGEIGNQGDGESPETELVISLGRGKGGPQLAAVPIRGLPPGGVYPIRVPVSVPKNLRPGEYELWAEVSPGSRDDADEYSGENNGAAVRVRVVR